MDLQQQYAAVESYVFEDNRVVTYKWLSKSLQVHVNIAKQILYGFIEKHGKSKLGITYLVAGESDGKHVMALVDEKNVPKLKQKLISVTSEHVYSVQKGSTIHLAPLYLADHEEFQLHPHEYNSHSAIKCDWAQLTTRLVAPRTSPNSKGERKHQITPAVQDKGVKKHLLDNLPSNSTTVPTKSTTPEAAKTSQNDPPKTVKEEQIKKTDNKKKTGIAAMFFSIADKQHQKETVAQKARNEKSLTLGKPEMKEDKKEHKSENKNEQKSNKIDVHPKKDVHPRTKKSEKSVKNKHKRTSSTRIDDSSEEEENNFQQKKKRRRIVQMSSSESEHEDGSGDEDISEPSSSVPLLSSENEVPDIIMKSPEPSNVRAKKRSMKTETKTFMDENGFLVTQKQQVTCTDSEGSDSETVKPPAKSTGLIEKNIQQPTAKDKPRQTAAAAKKALAGNGKSKQAMLTNFFQRK